MDTLRKRCERVEKEKSDILLRRLANIDTANKYTTGRSSEVLKLQQKVNELTSQNEDLKDEKKHLTLKVKEVEAELEVGTRELYVSHMYRDLDRVRIIFVLLAWSCAFYSVIKKFSVFVLAYQWDVWVVFTKMLTENVYVEKSKLLTNLF